VLVKSPYIFQQQNKLIDRTRFIIPNSRFGFIKPFPLCACNCKQFLHIGHLNLNIIIFFAGKQVTMNVPKIALVGTYVMTLITASNLMNSNFTFGEP
jgi:hypothetical protein